VIDVSKKYVIKLKNSDNEWFNTCRRTGEICRGNAMENRKPEKSIQSVNRALDILECISYSGSGYKLGELAARCNLNKTTAFHLLKTLAARGYVEKSCDSQIYKMGWKSYELFSAFYENLDEMPFVLPYMEEIRKQTGETVSLYNYLLYQGYYAGVCVHQLESAQPLKYFPKIGSRVPMHCTAAGKVHLLSYSGEELAAQMEKMPYPRYTPFTPANAQEVLAQLEEVKRLGFCIEREEYMRGICSVAVPLFKYNGRNSFTVSVSVPLSRGSKSRLMKIGGVMQDILRHSNHYSELLYREPPL